MNSLHIIGASALAVGREEMDNIAHNLANSMTEGYSRRENQLEALQWSFSDGVMLSGVGVAGVRRLADGFVAERVRLATGVQGEAEAFDGLLHQLDALAGDADAGYFKPLEQLQRSLQRASVRPDTQAIRQQVLSDAQAAATRLNQLHQRFMDFHNLISERVRISVAELNELTEQVAGLNEALRGVILAQGDAGPLLDERGLVLTRMAELAGTRVRDHGDKTNGMVDVYLPDGKILVFGLIARELSARPAVPDALVEELFVGQGTSPVDADSLQGSLGGLFAFRDQVLLPEQNQLGLQAALLASGSNRILAQGESLHGQPGAALFRSVDDPEAQALRVQQAGDNKGTASVQWVLQQGEEAMPALVASDYRLIFSEAKKGLLVRLADQKEMAFDLDQPLEIDGLEVSMTGSAEAGDRFLLSPWRHEAGQIKAVLTDPTQLGFAVRGSGPGDNRVLGRLLNYMQGFDYGIGQETRLQAGLTLLYERQVSRIATRARTESSLNKATTDLLADARNERDRLVGVNLDEEAANLLRFRQHYLANMKVLAAGVAMLDELLALL